MAYKKLVLLSSFPVEQNTVKTSQIYKGFSTANLDTASIKIYDQELIIRGLVNQFNTRKGERVMNPQHGCVIWDLLFEPFTAEVKEMVRVDVERVCKSDPRVHPIQIDINEQEYGILLEVTMKHVHTLQDFNMSVTFDKTSRTG